MKFKHKVTGIIYKVTNEEIIPLFENSEVYEPVKTEVKKTAKKAD